MSTSSPELAGTHTNAINASFVTDNDNTLYLELPDDDFRAAFTSNIFTTQLKFMLSRLHACCTWCLPPEEQADLYRKYRSEWNIPSDEEIDVLHECFTAYYWIWCSENGYRKY